jgi:GrpB-like predicted nucleotidyltransferase (UPF0157 family)
MPSKNQPSSDAEIRAHTIGELKPLQAGILLVDYDPRWPAMFLREADRIRRALGERALRVEHCGSTSVPGLAAKPIIDIILEVADSSAEETYVSALEAAGYVLRVREPDWNQHRMFKGPGLDINLHVYTAGCAEVERMLVFRDWLSVNKPDRELYERTKRGLAQKQWKYTQNYADAKSEVVAEIMERALKAQLEKR